MSITNTVSGRTKTLNAPLRRSVRERPFFVTLKYSKAL